MTFTIRQRLVIPVVILLSFTILAIGAIAFILQARTLDELMQSTTESKIIEFTQRIDRQKKTAEGTPDTARAGKYTETD